MRLNLKFLALPASILTLIAIHPTSLSAEENENSPKQWPYNLPPHVKYWPEDPPNRRRDLENIDEHFRQGRSPVGVMKMSTDEGEKFYMEYWQFDSEIGDGEESNGLRKRDEDEEARLLVNASAVLDFRPPFMVHGDDMGYGDLRARRASDSRNALAALEKRQFACPSGTTACSSIGQSNYCCPTTETCFDVQDTGLGPVGCCPNGITCGNTIASCGFPNTACSEELGGGCCIPNYTCAKMGCVSQAVTTVVITETITFTASSSTQISTIVVTTTSTSSSISPTASACASSFQSCPASLGGGCCPTDRLCASGTSCAPLSTATVSTTQTSTVLSTSSTATGSVPLRPTGVTTTTSSTTATDTTCPTGFYACQAFYAGGCCRTGRDCQTTSCPPTSSTTIISGSVTIVVPVGSAATVATPTGECASGWATCAASLGGNCCPSGWVCGTASCSSAGATSTGTLQKASPNHGVRRVRARRGFVMLVVGVLGGLLI